MKRAEEVMEILEAYDLAGSLRGAAALAGCDHKTVAHWVGQRELAGGMPAAERCKPVVGDYAGKIDELVDRSHGRIRADVAHGKLVALGYVGSERTTRRWVAEAKRRWRREHGRRTRPWIPEPGLWMQWDCAPRGATESDGGERPSSPGRRSGWVGAEGSLIREMPGRVASGPDNDGTDRHCQTVWARQARQKGVREEPAL